MTIDIDDNDDAEVEVPRPPPLRRRLPRRLFSQHYYHHLLLPHHQIIRIRRFQFQCQLQLFLLRRGIFTTATIISNPNLWRQDGSLNYFFQLLIHIATSSSSSSSISSRGIIHQQQ
jgi:hypothetical protein